MKAGEIRQELMDKYGYSKEQVDSIKGVANLRRELQDNILEVDPVEDSYVTASSEVTTSSPKWEEHILSLFREDEFIEMEGDRRPHVNALRRVAQEVFGEIVSSTVNTVQPPSAHNEHHACVEAAVEFANGKRFSDVADCHPHNTDPKYARHASSTAATKAESRALRKALQLRGISAEESSPMNLPELNDKINDAQIEVMDKVCKRYNVDLIDFVNSGNNHYNTIKEIRFEEASSMLAILNEDSKRKDYVETKKIGSYKENWRDYFESK